MPTAFPGSTKGPSNKVKKRQFLLGKEKGKKVRGTKRQIFILTLKFQNRVKFGCLTHWFFAIPEIKTRTMHLLYFIEKDQKWMMGYAAVSN